MFSKNKPDLTDLLKFFKVIARYKAANISIKESIPLFTEEVKKPSVKKIMDVLIRDLENGATFPKALSKHPSFFPAYIVEMMEVGESTGQTNKILDEIVFFLEQEIDIKREISAALWVPKAFLVAMVIMFVLGIFWAIPKMGELLSDAHIELPLVTRFVLGIGDVAQTFWWLFLLIAIFAGSIYRYFQREYPEKIDLLKLKVPFFKSITYNQQQYGFAKIFGLCIQAGVETTQSLQYAAMASESIVVKNTLKRAANDMKKTGISLADAIKKADVNKVIDPAFYIMLKVGITASTIGAVMINEAENYRKEMLIASKLLGEKVGISVTIPGYLVIVMIFASIEYPVMTMMQNLNIAGGA